MLSCPFFEKTIHANAVGVNRSKRGLVISIGSFSGVSVVSPMLATYAGTKSFLSSFSAALAEEVKDKGVDVECLNTYFVVRVFRCLLNGAVSTRVHFQVSNLSKIRRPSAMTPTPKAYVRSVLAKVPLSSWVLVFRI